MQYNSDKTKGARRIIHDIKLVNNISVILFTTT